MATLPGAILSTLAGIGCEALSSGTPAKQTGRAIVIDVLTAGTVTLTFVNGSTITLNLASSQIYQFNFCITQYTATAVLNGIYNIT